MECIYLNKEKRMDSQHPYRYCQYKLITMKTTEKIANVNEGEYQTFFIIKGKILIEWDVEYFGNQYVAKNEIFFVPKSSNCSIYVLEDTEIVVHICNMPTPKFHQYSMDYLKPLVSLAANLNYKIPSLPIRDILLPYLRTIKNYMRIGQDLKFIHEIKELELFCLFKLAYTKEELVLFYFYGFSNEFQFYNLVMNSYKGVRTAKELAEKCGYDRLTFQRLFKVAFKETPYKWLQIQTALQVKEDLQNELFSIKHIIEIYNFSSSSHFTTYCNRIFGMTPTELRVKNNISSEELDQNNSSTQTI